MKKLPSLGQQEMDLLKFINENSPLSVRDVSQKFDHLARTTVLTVMERLRKKGYLKRTHVNGVYQYSSRVQTREILKQKVYDFVQNTLGGSVAPLLNYFASTSDLTEEERSQLKELAKKIMQSPGGVP